MLAAGILVLLSACAEPMDGWQPEAPDPADKAASAVVEPAERAEHDAILDLPLKDEIQAVEQSLLRLGVLADFPDVFGAIEIDYDAAQRRCAQGNPQRGPAQHARCRRPGTDDIVGRTVTIDGEPIRLIGSISPAMTGSWPMPPHS